MDVYLKIQIDYYLILNKDSFKLSNNSYSIYDKINEIYQNISFFEIKKNENIYLENKFIY